MVSSCGGPATLKVQEKKCTPNPKPQTLNPTGIMSSRKAATDRDPSRRTSLIQGSG